MKYVLDASVALSWVMPRPLTSKALALRDDFRNHIHELIAPSTFGAEVASGLTKAERQKLIPAVMACTCLLTFFGHRRCSMLTIHFCFGRLKSLQRSGAACMTASTSPLQNGRGASSSRWMTSFSRPSRKTSRSSFTWGRYESLAYFRGTSLRPVPLGESKQKAVRYLDIHEDDPLDEAQLAAC